MSRARCRINGSSHGMSLKRVTGEQGDMLDTMLSVRIAKSSAKNVQT